MLKLYYDYVDSPIGRLLLAGREDQLQVLGFPTGKGARQHQADWIHEPTCFAGISQQLQEYFAGSRRDFSITLAPQGTPFQLRVWEALQSIPYGETVSYGELARAIGKPTASRAVGAANGRNPIPILIPCHRVIGVTGRLVGFGGGLAVKERLLALEQQGAR